MSKVELLKKLNKSLSPYKVDFSSIDSEINVLKKKMAETINIQTVDDVKYELDKFKKKLNLTSLSDEIKSVSATLQTQQTDLKNQIERKYKELDTIKNSIIALDGEQSARISALEEEVNSLTKTYASKEEDLKTFKTDIKSFERTLADSFQSLTDNIDSRFTKTEAKKAIKEIQDVAEQNRKDLLNRIGSIGGGSKPLRILNNGTDISKRYADVNLKGSGVTITTADNNTTRQVDVTLTAGGGGTSVRGEIVSFSGTTGTLANTPTSAGIDLYRGGIWQQPGGGDYTLSGSTITLTTAASAGEVFAASYQF